MTRAAPAPAGRGRRVRPRPFEILLALGLLLSFATQLRIGDLPIGPGEACLAAGIAGLALAALGDRSARTTPALWTVLHFWAVFLAAQLIGFSVGGVIGDLSDTQLVLHDAATYPVLIALVCVLTRGPDEASRLERLVAALVALSIPLMVLQLAGAVGLVAVPNTDTWYWDRFRGWTANPNQMALFCLLVGSLSAHRCVVARSWCPRAGAVVACGLAFVSGLLTKTNAFNLAVVVAAALTLVLPAARHTWHALFMPGIPAARSLRQRVLASLVLIGLPILTLSAIPLAAPIGSIPAALAGASRDGAGQTGSEAEVRVELWNSALSRSMGTALLGLGPGPHLPIPSVLRSARWGDPFEPINVQHPTIGEIPNFESHNSLLEALLQGGLLGAASLAALAGTALIRLLRASHFVLFAFTLGLLLFGCFHVITRHPALWFILVLGLSTSSGTAAAGRTGSPSRARRPPRDQHPVKASAF